MATLTVTVMNGTDTGRSAVFEPGRAWTVGRARSCDLATMDFRMSRNHFRFDCDAGGWCVCDLGSSNGTTLNGEPVDQASLCEGDVIEAGDTRFEVSLVAPASPVMDDAGDHSRNAIPGSNLQTWTDDDPADQ